LNLCFPVLFDGTGLKKASQQIVVLRKNIKSLLAGPMELGCCEAREPKKPVTVLASFFAVRWMTLERPVAGSNEL
jgi:hypothetical protein